MAQAEKILFIYTHEDEPYLPKLRGLVGSTTISLIKEANVTTIAEIEVLSKKHGFSGVALTSKSVLRKLLGKEKASIDNYAGSLFVRGGLSWVVCNPLKQLITVPYGEFLARRYLSKITRPESWPQVTAFNWLYLTAANIEQEFEAMRGAYAIACDIETIKSPLAITHVGYTGIFLDADGSIRTRSLVLKVESMWGLTWVRKFNDLPIPKIFQNGKYDISYLARFSAVPVQWYWDTINLHHCWYCELPKDLASLQAFYVREAMYWKDLADTSDPMEYALYNAKDTWATANVWIQQMLQLPAWAKRNYLEEFPVNYPAHVCEMTGVKRDEKIRRDAEHETDEKIKALQSKLEQMVAVPGFNPGSPKQVAALLQILGCKDLESTDEKSLNKAALRHPLNHLIISAILEIRGLRKLNSTYLCEGKELNGRTLYALNPHGTDTGRLASKEHHFWCGLQIQNQPRGPEVKRTFVADTGFYFAESDLEQAESRDTAFITGDANLIAAVSSGKDFHSTNASSFFGVPYDSIYDDSTGKTKDKPLRDLAKRVNHGANYNMGAGVLVDTMGEDKIWEAKRLLKLPKQWSTKEVAQHLLAQFHKTYPRIAGLYYPRVVTDVVTTQMLVSTAEHYCERPEDYQGVGGWTRYCFGRPDKSKTALNAYVAHCPQSLNAKTLNRAFMAVFYELWLPHYKNFKLCAQIHDSILFQYREGYDHLAVRVKELMEIPVTLKSCDGVVRTFTVPAALKAGKNGKPAKYWSETE